MILIRMFTPQILLQPNIIILVNSISLLIKTSTEWSYWVSMLGVSSLRVGEVKNVVGVSGTAGAISIAIGPL